MYKKIAHPKNKTCSCRKQNPPDRISNSKPCSLRLLDTFLSNPSSKHPSVKDKKIIALTKYGPPPAHIFVFTY